MSEKVLLLVNLGSPDSCQVKDVRTYLSEFLMDEKVIDIPYLGRLLLVKGIIVPFRAPKSAAKYKSIWTENGSPLIQLTKELTSAVETKTGIPSYMCMRYANPTPQSVLERIKKDHPDLKELVALPLYPHYAMSSYDTALSHVQEAFQNGSYDFQLTPIRPFYNHPSYIQSLSSSIKPYLKKEYDHLLFSYHGIPERHIRKSDITGNHCLQSESCCETTSIAHNFCYRHQIKSTTKLVATQLKLEENKYSYSFQSRLGQDKWLRPYTAEILSELPAKGIKKLLVVCPAFVSDCLETLEEIAMEGREIFLHAGGESYEVIPCLNTHTEWIQTISVLYKEAN